MIVGELLTSITLFKKEKHSMSSIWTSSIKRTPGTIYDFPYSFHYYTFKSTCCLTYSGISPVSPEKRAKNPWALELMTSI
jgi:hypothetical protein